MGKLWIASNSDFLRVLQGLLPRGVIWSREPARRLTRLLTGLADELTLVHNRAGALIDQADPQTTTELLAEWERVCGLPDGPFIVPEGDRRGAVLARLAARGGQSESYFESLATLMGATHVDVLDGPCPLVWTVSLPDNVTRIRAGSQIGVPLVTFDDLAKRICWSFEKYKPANTLISWIDWPLA